MTTVAELEVLVGADISDLQSGLKKAERETEGFATKGAKNLKYFGDAFSYIKDGAAAAFDATVGKAIEFESAFAEVVKTVDATDEQLADLEKTIRKMATDQDNPLSALENSAIVLTEIAASAGALGIATQDIDEFTQTVGALTVASDMSADSAATFLARFSNVTGLPVDQYDNLGNAIVELGNSMAATESEIAAFGTRLAPLAAFGWDATDIIGYSAALASLGVSPELGATNLIKSIDDMTTAVQKGGPELSKYAEIAGMSAQDFKALSESDPSAAFTAFVEGLSKLPGPERLAVFEKLNITGTEQKSVLNRLAEGYGTVEQAMNTSEEAMRNSNAMMDEATKKADTTAGRIETFKNNADELGRTLGEAVIPTLNDLATGATDAVSGLNKLSDGDHQGIYDLASGLGDIADALVPEELFGDVDMGEGLTAFVQGMEAAGYSAQVIFDRIHRGILNFVTNAKLSFIQFASDMRDSILNVTGVDIAPQISIELSNIQMEAGLLAEGDNLTAMLKTALGDQVLDMGEVVRVDPGGFQQTLESQLASLGSLSPETKQRIADSLGFEAKDVIQRALTAAAASGNDEAYASLIDIAKMANIDLTPVQAALQARTAAMLQGVFAEPPPGIGERVSTWLGGIFANIPEPTTDISGGAIGGLLTSIQTSISGMMAETAEPANLGEMPVTVDPVIPDAVGFHMTLAGKMNAAIMGQVYVPVLDTMPDTVIDAELPGRVQAQVEALPYEATVQAYITVVPHVDASAIGAAVGNAVGNAAYYTGTTQAAQGGAPGVGIHHSGGQFTPMDGGNEGYAWLKRGETIRTGPQERDLQRKLNGGGGGGDTYQIYGSSPYDVAEMVARANQDRGY